MIIYFVIGLCSVVNASSEIYLNSNKFNLNEESNTISDEFEESVPKLISEAGYKLEEHNVITEDGYILTMHRIPCSKTNCNNVTRIPVLCVHGLFASSSSYILLGPGQSLGYILADAGYDVWLGNTRGSLYSRNHVMFYNESMEFWNFSFHEKGVYDIPAMIDYILNITGNSKLVYIGHSEGTTDFYVLLSVRPEYNKKISIGFMMSPVVHVKHSRIPFLDVITIVAKIFIFVHRQMGGQLVTLLELIVQYKKLICREAAIFKILCILPFALFLGFRIENFEPKTFNLYLTSAQGVSVMELLHYSQLYKTGDFQWFDYGLIENVLKYNSIKPPLYDLCQVIVPTILFYSNNDLVISYEDVCKLNLNLRQSALKVTEDATISHLDFLMGKTAKKVIYDKILEILNSNITLKFPPKDSTNC